MRAIFVQIKCEMGQAYRVAREAADTIGEMSELFSTSGQYDLLGKFYLDADQDIGLFVTDMYALSWVGLWHGLTAQNSTRTYVFRPGSNRPWRSGGTVFR